MGRLSGTARSAFKVIGPPSRARIRLGKFVHLPPAERWLVIEAVLVLGLIRLALWLLPLQRLRSLMTYAADLLHARTWPDSSLLGRAGRAVDMACTCVPQATCLPRALAVQFLLERRGYSADLRIGFARGAQRQLTAHAWIEHRGQVIFGGGFPAAEVVLSGLGGKQRNGA